MSSSFGGDRERVIAPEDRPKAERTVPGLRLGRPGSSRRWKAPRSASRSGPRRSATRPWPPPPITSAATAPVHRRGPAGRARLPPTRRRTSASLRSAARRRPRTSARPARSSRWKARARPGSRRMPSGFPLRARWTTLNAFPVDQQVSFSDEKGPHRDAPGVPPRRLGLAGRGGEEGGPLGAVLRLRRPCDDRPGAGRGDRVPIDPATGTRRSPAGWRPISSSPMRRAAIPPGRPIVATLRLRNDRGVEQPVPTEFLRPGDDGRPALRRGVAIVLKELPKRSDKTGLRRPPADRAGPDAGGPVRPRRRLAVAGPDRVVRRPADRPRRLVRPARAGQLYAPPDLRGRLRPRRGGVGRRLFAIAGPDDRPR